MRPTSLVPDPAVVTLEELVADDAGVTLVLRTRRSTACCPVCDHPATCAHRWYTRRLADLPWQGLAVCPRLRTRRRCCDNPRCARRIFTERLPTIALPHAQRTRHLATIVLVCGVAVGGAPGARLLAALGIGVSGDTLPDAVMPRVLGVDDWSLKQGRTDGTILVDLEAHRPVDLLPDRAAASVAAWRQAHPGTAISCRDRGASADGATQGAPDAVQVADRWHRFANLGDQLERLLLRHHAALSQVRLATAAPPAPPAGVFGPDTAGAAPALPPPIRSRRRGPLASASAGTRASTGSTCSGPRSARVASPDTDEERTFAHLWRVWAPLVYTGFADGRPTYGRMPVPDEYAD